LCRQPRVWRRAAIAAGVRSLPVFVSLLTAGCSVPIKGYDGPALPGDQTAQIRAVRSGDALLEVRLLHAVTSVPLDHGIVTTYDRTPWMSVPAGDICIKAGSRWLECPSLVEALNPHNAGCRGITRWVDREICFTPLGGESYEVEARTEKSERCQQRYALTGFRLVNVNSGDIVLSLPVGNECQP